MVSQEDVARLIREGINVMGQNLERDQDTKREALRSEFNDIVGVHSNRLVGCEGELQKLRIEVDTQIGISRQEVEKMRAKLGATSRRLPRSSPRTTPR